MSPNQTSNQSPNQAASPMQAGPSVFPGLGGALLWLGAKWFAIGLFFLLVLVCAWPLFPFVVGVVLLILIRHGETQRRVNCWTLALAVEKRIPLSRTLASLAAESGTLMRLRLGRLFSYIESGARFEDAICGVPKVVPRFSLPLLRIGCLSGRPSRAMQIICSQEDSENYKLGQTLLGRFLYLLLCYLFVTVVSVFMLIKIVPAFEKIFADFGLSLGPFFRVSVDAGYFIYCYWYLGGFPILLLIAFCLYVLLRLIGVVTFDLPGMKRLMRKSHRARVQETLALAAECEMPINNALRELALFYPTWDIRSRLGRVTDRVNSGRDWKAELRDVDLLSQTEYAVVESAEASGDLPWTLRLLAEKGRRRMMYWAQWGQQLLFIGLLFLFGLVVAMLGLATFEFLTKIITLLS